ncbi:MULTISPECIES: DUF2933 domain-containing protein [Hyphomicrobiales]|uniref:DUF2933 domain-containing protein n=1 Tax=Agrobacterium pusense TaxID=648995 RepID=A0AA44J167_9HYPH|nr:MULTISPECIES: DUF2933 domain-containing protein [Hyphomicrobiales]KAB2737363.1 DUF2933 domain-containing protein [Brucella anthropi]NRF11379.1 DUF2933 domain-containing protein [Agrobacterium pusense]NRF22089.1 DUF2933 domain-containing protein [Agrobacterium pusense]
MKPDPDQSQFHNHRRWFSPANLVLYGFLAIGAFYLLAEHRAHLLGWLPFLLLLACPLLHFFMHGRHGGHGNHGSDDRQDPSARRQPPHEH